MRSGKLLCAALLMLVGGCATYVPAKLQVTDVGSGKTFVTYGDWGRETWLGYTFVDAKSGDRVMLKGYQLHELRPAGYYKRGTEQLEEFQADNDRRLHRPSTNQDDAQPDNQRSAPLPP